MNKNLAKKIRASICIMVILLLAMSFQVFASEVTENNENQQKIETAIPAVCLGVHSKGFKPSKNNYLRISANIVVDSYYNTGAKLRIRVLDSKNKYVFQKTYSDVGTGFLDYKWNGKASKNNAAGSKAGAFVKAGTYKVELCLYNDTEDYKDVFQKTVKKKTVKINSKAPSGEKGYYGRKSFIRYTGNYAIDYMAEQMIKSAGVKSDMSKDAKVKKIYHYMLKNFKHTHYDEFYKRKIYYDFDKLESKINAYGKKADKKVLDGKALYTYRYTYEEANMQRRAGVCDDNAAMFAILCNHVGVDAGVCNGQYLNRSGKKSPHAWNYAVVGGKIYYYDIDVEIQNKGKGQGDYYWYKKTLSQAKKTHSFSSYGDR